MRKLAVQSRLISSALVLATAMVVGCGGAGSGSGGTTSQSGGGAGAGLNLPAGHTQQWVTQIEKQGLTQLCPTPTYCAPTNTVYSEAIDYQGNVVIAGQTNILFTQAPAPAWNYNGFVAKYSTSGSLLWIQQFGPEASTGFDEITSVVTDEEGSIYAGGMTAGAYTGYSNPDKNLDLVLAKLDANGNILWVQQYQTGLYLFNILGEGITLTPSGAIAFGWTCASTTGGSGNQSFFYVVSPDSGNLLWMRTYPGLNEMGALVSDTAGNLIATGVSSGVFPGSMSSTDVVPYVVKFNGTSGDVIWQQSFTEYISTTQSLIGFSAITEDSAGNVLLGGGSTPADGELCAGLCDLPSIQGQSALVAEGERSDWGCAVGPGFRYRQGRRGYGNFDRRE